MKWLILLGLLVLVGILIAARYRRQIQMALYVWRMFRKMRQAGNSEEKQIDTNEDSQNVPLIRCAKCGTWTPQKKALNLRTGVYYCSANCMEKAVKV